MKLDHESVPRITDHYQDVAEFNQATLADDRGTPGIPAAREVAKYLSLIGEMHGKFCEGVSRGSVLEVAEALVGLEYVVHGAARAFGIDTRRLWPMVHQHNMEKVRDGVTATSMGKIERPVYLEPLDISVALASQGEVKLGEPLRDIRQAVRELLDRLMEKDVELEKHRLVRETQTEAIRDLRAQFEALDATRAAHKRARRKAGSKRTTTSPRGKKGVKE